MRDLVTVLIATLFAAGSARGQDVIHLLGPSSKTDSPAAPDLVARRIASAAQRYQQYAPIPRVAFFDIAYPGDTAEYRRMAGYGVVLITAMSQSEDELPVTPYLMTSQGDLHLQFITSAVGSTQIDDSLVHKVFGKYRIDALYLMPLHSGAARGSELLVDFARNRQGFTLGGISETLPGYLRTFPATELIGAVPSQDAILQLIRREYPGFVAPL